MNETKLSKRLETVALMLNEGCTFADIGSDHAYLPCYAVLNGIALKAIAGEISEGPYQSAVSQVIKSKLDSKISVRKGNGLEILTPGEVQCMTIAGMGGSLIAQILENGKDKLTGSERLVLQPNIHSHHVRTWLYKEHYEILQETILEEDDKIYEVIAAEKGDRDRPYQSIMFEAGILTGPLLAKEKNDVFRKKWSFELEHLNTIYTSVKKAADSETNREKMKEILTQINLIEEVLSHV
ncbi:tRNA (adenine(22)-N(1))-methyltransferase TrmK [Bacillus gobiensis]|uniref:tRNA (adenine(22)-N(1))-methyltransferase n=1 Tax=Bacillus gobiensis TaxID=1441095 RepID=UPI003D1E9A7F